MSAGYRTETPDCEAPFVTERLFWRDPVLACGGLCLAVVGFAAGCLTMLVCG